MLTLYDYQETAIKNIRRSLMSGNKRVMLCSPTGSGKTAMASYMIHSAANNGNRSLFIVDRIVLVPQAVRHLESLGLKVGIYQGANTCLSADDEVIVASIQTIRARADRIDQLGELAFVVIDEAHLLHKAHIELMEAWSDKIFIGLSATPLREDLGQYFQDMIISSTMAELTERGYLTRAKGYCPVQSSINKALSNVSLQSGDFKSSELSDAVSAKEIIGDIVSTWKRLANDKPTIVFACTIAHAKLIRDDFISEGIPAASIDKDTPDEERQELFRLFNTGEIKVLTSINVLSIGFDSPCAEVAILARPTLSLALHIQQIGRVLRLFEGKEFALLLDHANNVLRHGMPEHFVVPPLSDIDRETGKAKRKDKAVSTCDNCGYVLEPEHRTCPACGTERSRRKSEVVNASGELAEIGHDYVAEVMNPAFYQELRGYAISKRYNDKYAKVNYKNRYGIWPPRNWDLLPPLQPSLETSRWLKHQLVRYLKSRKRQ